MAKVRRTVSPATTLTAEIAGQGFAFDHSQPGVIYGIIRKQDGSEVTVSRITPPGVPAYDRGDEHHFCAERVVPMYEECYRGLIGR